MSNQRLGVNQLLRVTSNCWQTNFFLCFSLWALRETLACMMKKVLFTHFRMFLIWSKYTTYFAMFNSKKCLMNFLFRMAALLPILLQSPFNCQLHSLAVSFTKNKLSSAILCNNIIACFVWSFLVRRYLSTTFYGLYFSHYIIVLQCSVQEGKSTVEALSTLTWTY